MSIVYRLDGALLPFQSVRFNPEAEASFPSAAFYGEPMIAGVIIEDTAGTLDIDGWHTFTVEETSCSKPRIFTGWIAGREISRGRDSNRAGAARVWNCDIIDQNAAFSFEVLRSTAASVRPQETDVERVTAIIESHAMAGTPVHDNGRLSTANPLNLSATNFVTQYPAEALISSAGQCAKNYYAYWDEAADHISIHYDAVGAGPAATISFSNVPGDYGDVTSSSTTCFPPSRDATLVSDPYNLYNGVLLGWVGGFTYSRNQTLIDELSPSEFSPSNFLRDQVVRSDRIGKAATAATYIQTLLDQFAAERVTLTFSAIVHASKVNLAHAGDVVTVRFSHLPGYESNTEVAIVRRSVRPVDDHDSLYEISFECADFATATAGGGSGGNLPHPPAGSPSLVQFKVDYDPIGNPSVTLDLPPTPGGVLFMWRMTDGPTFELPAGFTQIEGIVEYPDVIGNDAAAMFYRVVEPGDPTTYSFAESGAAWIAVAEFEGLGDLVDSDSVDQGAGPTSGVPFTVGTVTATGPSLLISIGGYGDNNPPSRPLSPVTSTELFDTVSGVPWWSVGYRSVVAGTYNEQYVYTGGGSEDGTAGIVAIFGLAEGVPPLPGQPVPPTTPTPDPDGTETDFTTPDAFAAGSLYLLHDGIDQTDHITSSDEDTGEFTLDYAPSAGSTLRTGYQGHP